MDRHSIRLKEYDYSNVGGYFATIVTLGRECLFGEIIDGEMRFNTLGKIVQECWLAIPNHFPNTDVDLFVVMPNHIHGIIVLYEKDNSSIARARRASPLPKPSITLGFNSGTLSAIIGSFKSAVTKRIGREINPKKIWQRNYYEHIIRDAQDFERIANYITENVGNWVDDEEYLVG